jgi:hypothetical protein
MLIDADRTWDCSLAQVQRTGWGGARRFSLIIDDDKDRGACHCEDEPRPNSDMFFPSVCSPLPSVFSADVT